MFDSYLSIHPTSLKVDDVLAEIDEERGVESVQIGEDGAAGVIYPSQGLEHGISANVGNSGSNGQEVMADGVVADIEIQQPIASIQPPGLQQHQLQPGEVDEDDEEEVIDYNDLISTASNPPPPIAYKRIDDPPSQPPPLSSSSLLESTQPTAEWSDLLSKKAKLESLLSQRQTFNTNTKILNPTFSPNRRKDGKPPGFSKEQTKLVVDTNVYIDHLEVVKGWVEAGWVVVVPLAVITELDGLTSSTLTTSTKLNLPILAQSALTYLETHLFNSSLKLVTSRNTQLSSLTFRTETFSSEIRVLDDVFVHVAWLIHEKGERVVLVSEDVNMRLKARGRGLDVGGVRDVAGWIRA
ncbi:hypothetical protein HDV05_006175 [Chytridiales sp. JEL 0842]|nr:hypothetical protein HDV05_006175 [Chytridiales sp. JEL 0842]